MRNKTRNDQRFFAPRKSIRFSKKSQLEDLLPLLLLMLFLLFLFMFAFIVELTREKRTTVTIDLQSQGKDSSQLLIIFLKSSFAFDNIEINNVADAINYYFLTGDEVLLKQIDKQAKEFFSTSKLESDRSFWSLDIEHSGKKILIIESDETTGYFLKREISDITLPTSILDELIEIKLFFFVTKFTVK